MFCLFSLQSIFDIVALMAFTVYVVSCLIVDAAVKKKKKVGFCYRLLLVVVLLLSNPMFWFSAGGVDKFLKELVEKKSVLLCLH